MGSGSVRGARCCWRVRGSEADVGDEVFIFGSAGYFCSPLRDGFSSELSCKNCRIAVALPLESGGWSMGERGTPSRESACSIRVSSWLGRVVVIGVVVPGEPMVADGVAEVGGVADCPAERGVDEPRSSSLLAPYAAGMRAVRGAKAGLSPERSPLASANVGEIPPPVPPLGTPDSSSSSLSEASISWRGRIDSAGKRSLRVR